MLSRSRRRSRRGIRRPSTRGARLDVLRRSLSLLRATIDSTADGILVVDRRGRIEAYNQRFAEMWGIPRAIRPGADDDAALALVRGAIRDPDAFLSRVRALYHMPEAESFDVVELCDGRIFERYSQPQRIGRRCVGRVWSFRDVTDRRRAEAERDRLLGEEQAARAAAERAVRARDEFFAVASHELKTPLTSLLLSVQHLLRHAGERSPEEIARALSVVERQGRRLGGLVDALLDVSRLQSSPLELHCEEVELDAIVRAVVADLRDEARTSGSRIELALAPVAGRWDRARVAQAIGCLVRNALKYGEGRPIQIGLVQAASEAVLTVRDSGVGIDPACVDRIFGRFERASSAEHYPGLGLGLFFARSIAEAHGGSIHVESAPRSGSTFTLRLPLA